MPGMNTRCRGPRVNVLEALRMPFVQNALAAGVLVAVIAGYFGVFVVQRGMSFLGDGLAHAAFGGVALGLLIGLNPLYVAAPFTLAAALAIMWVKDRTSLGSDTAIGVLFAVSVALGVVFLSFRQQYTADAFSYLFGSILFISKGDLQVTAMLAAMTAASAKLWPRWAAASFDREIAQTEGIPVVQDDYVLVAMIAVTVVVAVKLVGIVLIASFLVIPAATARLLSRTFSQMTVLSMGIAVLCAVSGLLLSIRFNLPSGAAIILAMATLFFLAALRRSK